MGSHVPSASRAAIGVAAANRKEYSRDVFLRTVGEDIFIFSTKKRKKRSRCFCCLDPIPPLRGGAKKSGANGVAMPTDEDDQDGHFFYNHPERGAYSAA